MENFLARVQEEFGSMVDYAREAGIAGADIERLRSRLVERR